MPQSTPVENIVLARAKEAEENHQNGNTRTVSVNDLMMISSMEQVNYYEYFGMPSKPPLGKYQD